MAPDHTALKFQNWHAWMDARTWRGWREALMAEASRRGVARRLDADDASETRWRDAFESGLSPMEALDAAYGAVRR
jgi:hypothetical protein